MISYFGQNNVYTDLTNLKDCQRLRVLDISRNSLISLKGLGQLKSLVVLNVSKNQLRDLNSEAFGELKSCESLGCLDLSDNKIERCSIQANGGSIAVPEFFAASTPNLRTLSLQGNPIPVEDRKRMKYFLTSLVSFNGSRITPNPVLPELPENTKRRISHMRDIAIARIRQQDLVQSHSHN